MEQVYCLAGYFVNVIIGLKQLYSSKKHHGFYRCMTNGMPCAGRIEMKGKLLRNARGPGKSEKRTKAGFLRI
jgi:hypothetical protein